jgi:hypothetical protein
MTNYTNLIELVHFDKGQKGSLLNLIRTMFHFHLITVLLQGAIHNSKGQGCTHLLPLLLLPLVQPLVQFQLLQNKMMQKAKL